VVRLQGAKSSSADRRPKPYKGTAGRGSSAGSPAAASGGASAEGRGTRPRSTAAPRRGFLGRQGGQLHQAEGRGQDHRRPTIHGQRQQLPRQPRGSSSTSRAAQTAGAGQDRRPQGQRAAPRLLIGDTIGGKNAPDRGKTSGAGGVSLPRPCGIASKTGIFSVISGVINIYGVKIYVYSCEFPDIGI